jgi:hypothetical protein
LKSAVRAPPTWRKPVGLGAKRSRTCDMKNSFVVDALHEAAKSIRNFNSARTM